MWEITCWTFMNFWRRYSTQALWPSARRDTELNNLCETSWLCGISKTRTCTQIVDFNIIYWRNGKERNQARVSLTHLLYLSRKVVCICSLDVLFWFTTNQTRTVAIIICKDLNNLIRDMRLLIFQIHSNAYLLFTANISRSNALFVI